MERSAHEKAVTYPHLECSQGYCENLPVLWRSFAGQHSSTRRFYEDKIISLGLMTQAAALGNQILPQRFEITLKTKVEISHFC